MALARAAAAIQTQPLTGNPLGRPSNYPTIRGGHHGVLVRCRRSRFDLLFRPPNWQADRQSQGVCCRSLASALIYFATIQPGIVIAGRPARGRPVGFFLSHWTFWRPTEGVLSKWSNSHCVKVASRRDENGSSSIPPHTWQVPRFSTYCRSQQGQYDRVSGSWCGGKNFSPGCEPASAIACSMAA